MPELRRLILPFERSIPVKMRRLIAACLCLSLLFIGAPHAQKAASGGGTRTEQKDNAAILERRLAKLESQIAQILREIQSLRADLKLPPAVVDGRVETRVFPLRYAMASAVTVELQPLFLTDPLRPSRVVADVRTNSVIMLGTPEQIDFLKKLIERIDEPSPKL